MRIRTMLTAFLLAGVATLPMAGTALAADRDCPDFHSQEEAQEAFEAAYDDPERLDRDDDGVACEDHFDDEPVDDTSDDDGDAPVGSVAAGGGGTAGDAAPAAPLALAGASALVIGVACAAGRRSGRQRG